MIKNKNVLIIDDDVDFAESLVDILEGEGYAKEVAYSLKDAKEAINDFDAQVALIDIRLGSDSGLSVLKHYRKQKPDMLCIMMTAYAEVETAIQAMREGAFDYLRKPLNADDLLIRLERCYDILQLSDARKRAEESLRKSEQKYRNLVESMNEGLLIHDETGVITYANNRFCNLLNYSSDDLIGKQVINLLDSANLDIFISQSSNSKESEPSSYELFWTKSTGGKLPTIVSPRLITDDSGNFKGRFYVITDISEIKRYETFVRTQHDLWLNISTTNDMKKSLKLLVDAALKISGMDNGSIFMVDHASGTVHLAHFEGVSDDFARARSVFDANHWVTKTLMKGEPLYRGYEEIGYSIEQTQRGEGLRSYAMIPIIHENRTLASLNVGSHYENMIPLDVRSMLEALASQAGGVIARIEAEENVAKGRAILDNIINLNPYGMVVFGTDGKFVKANRAFMNHFGAIIPEYYSVFKEKFLSQPEIVEKLDRVKLGEMVKIDNIEFNPANYNKSFADKDLYMSITFFPIFAPHGGVESIVGMFEDITESVAARKSLVESEGRFKAIVNSAQDIIFIKDKEFKYTLANPKNLEFLGVSEDEIIGKTDVEYWGAEKAEKARTIDRRVLKGETVRYEVSFTSGHGETRTFDMVKLPMRDSTGEVVSICGIAHDITERMKFEESLIQYQKKFQSLVWQLTQTEEHERHQLATWLHDNISQSLALAKIKVGALHDFCMNDESCMSSQASEVLKDLNQLLNQMIKETRQHTFELNPPILYELGLPAAVEWLVEEFQNNHGITIRFQDETNDINVDDTFRGFLFRCIRELLVNVMKHAEASEVDIKIQSCGKMFRFHIKDNGKGLDSKTLSHEQHEEQGFGLFSIRERLKNFEGILEIDSEPGNGTLVRIEIPLQS